MNYRQLFTEALDKVRNGSELKEFKKMTVTIKDPIKRAKAIKDMEKYGYGNDIFPDFKITKMGDKFKVDGQGADLNKFAKDLKNFYGAEIKAEENIKEADEKDHEISMARGELEAIADKAMKLSSILSGKSDDGNPLEAWVQSKITKAKDYINSVADYMEYNPDMNEAFTTQQIKMAYGVANDPRYKAGNYSGAVAAIEKIAKGLSKHPDVMKVLKRVNEEVELDEAMKQAYVIRFRRPKDKENMVVVFVQKHDADIYVDHIKKQGGKVFSVKQQMLNIKEEDDKEAMLKRELDKKDDEIAQLKKQAETDKAKAVKKSTEKMVNPETGEPLLQVGIAHKFLNQQQAKEKASEDDLKQKEKENKRKMVQKFRDRIKGRNEETDLTESEASDKAKSMGLTYMKFGRYGKDGKVTHKTSGNSLVKVDKDGNEVEDKPKSDEPQKDTSKDTPSKEPKLDPFDVKKDLEDQVTDGMIDVETTEQGGLYMTKEYEPSQDYEAENDVEAIEKYLKSKGVDVDKDVMIEIDNDEDDGEDGYIQIHVEYRPGKTMKPESVQRSVLEMFSDAQVSMLKRAYAPLKGAKISMDRVKQLNTIIDKIENQKSALEKLAKAGIPFVSTAASTKLMTKHNYKAADLKRVGAKFEELEEETLLEMEDYGLRGRISNTQLANIKKVWAKKTPKDVTQGIRDMIKKMDAPTKVAIKIAKINVLSDLVEGLGLEEGKMKQIATMMKQGKGAEEIAKVMGMPVSTVKSVLGESHYKVNSHVMVKNKPGQIVHIDTPETGAYYTVKMSDSGENVKCKPSDITLVEANDLPTEPINQKKHTAYADPKKGEKKIVDPKPKLKEGTMKGGIIKYSGQSSSEYNKAKMAYKQFMSKSQPAKGAEDKVMSFIFDDELLDDLYVASKKNVSDVRPIVKKRLKSLGINEKFEHPAKEIYESIAAVKKKAEKTGMPYSVLKQVYDRGMAAWKGGHRPGATQVQWALARVNSFVTKSSGTWGGADSDLAKKVKGSK